MNNAEIIAREYAEAVKGMHNELFANKRSKWYDYVMGLPIQLRITYLVVVLHNQVFNGGFHQYFVNGYGQFARETIDALIEIGAFKKAELLKQALEKVNADNDTDILFRKRLLEKEIKLLFAYDDLFEPLDELDTQYYADKKEDIQQLLGDYLHAS